MKTKNMLETLKNLEIEVVLDFLDNVVKDEVRESYINPSFQGWHKRIVLNEDEELFVTGALSCGTYLMSEHNGEAFCLATINAYEEISGDLITYDDVKCLTDEEKERLLNWIQNEYEVLDEDDYEEEITLNTYLENICVNLDGAFNELFREKYDNALDELIDAYWSDYHRDNILTEIEENIRLNFEEC